MAPRIPAQRGGEAPRSNWKDHPVVIAAGSVAATLTATVAIFLQVVIPTRELDLKNAVNEARRERSQLLQRLATSAAELAKARDDLNSSQKALKDVQADLKVALQAQLFAFGDPYPNGLKAVRVGESIDVIMREYRNAKRGARGDGMITLKSANVFSNVSFFFDAEAKDKRISHIVFEIEDRDSYEPDFLQRKLRDALGAPRSNAVPEQFGWIKEKGHSVFKAEPYSFIVAAEGVTPRWWRPK